MKNGGAGAVYPLFLQVGVGHLVCSNSRVRDVMHCIENWYLA